MARWVLSNPISEDLKAMRPAAAGAAVAARRNLARGKRPAPVRDRAALSARRRWRSDES
jgi:hypothetical protein